MTTSHKTDPFGARDTFNTLGGKAVLYRLAKLEELGLGRVSALPYSIRLLLESLLRNCDGYEVTEDDVRNLAGWNAAEPAEVEIPFKPARVVLQDFTGVPCVVDLAAMRSAMKRLGGDPRRINPLVPVDLVIDHSVQVDQFGSLGALAFNVELEFQRNRERYEFLRWGQKAFANFRVVPPNIGIVHQVNLEFLAKGVFLRPDSAASTLKPQSSSLPLAVPDTLVGTDSHTTMINGLGVVGWGVGGIEAEAVMLGQPLYMLLPEVVGFELTGQLPAGATATDLKFPDPVTQILRKRKGWLAKFVEFFGPGVSRMSVADRATIGNMAPEYGATIGFFPTDAETLNYLRATGRTDAEVDLVERYYKEQGLFRTDDAPAPTFSKRLKLDLGSVESSVAGPKRPQDRVPLSNVKQSFEKALTGSLDRRAAALGSTPSGGQPPCHGGRLWPFGRNRPRGRRHRRDHQLHKHKQSVGHAGRGTGGQSGGRARNEGQAVCENEPRPRIARGDRLSQASGADRVARCARFSDRRLRLHHLHRQQRPVARRGRQGGEAG